MSITDRPNWHLTVFLSLEPATNDTQNNKDLHHDQLRCDLRVSIVIRAGDHPRQASPLRASRQIDASLCKKDNGLGFGIIFLQTSGRPLNDRVVEKSVV